MSMLWFPCSLDCAVCSLLTGVKVPCAVYLKEGGTTKCTD